MKEETHKRLIHNISIECSIRYPLACLLRALQQEEGNRVNGNV